MSQAEHNTVADDVLEQGGRRAGCQHITLCRTSRRSDRVLDDEVCRVVVLEPFWFSKGDAPVRRAWAGRTTRRHVFHAAHGGLAGQVVRFRQISSSYGGGAGRVRRPCSRQAAEVCLELFEEPYTSMRGRSGRRKYTGIGNPRSGYGRWTSRDVLSPLAGAAVLHVFRIELICLFSSYMLSLKSVTFTYQEVITVDEQGAATPAVRVSARRTSRRSAHHLP